MEWAFTAPYLLAERLGQDPLDAGAIAAADPDEFAAAFASRPALHRFPGSMAKRVQALCRYLVDAYDGDASALWSTAGDGAELVRRLKALPGFGEQKAKIFAALLGKQLGVRPPGWQEAAAPYGDDGVHRSVADVTGPDTLALVRDYKRSVKAAAKKSG